MAGPSLAEPGAAGLAELVRATLKARGRLRWPLRGTSMAPTLPADCEVEVAPLIGRPRLGALVVFCAEDVLVAHRLVQRRAGRWITQGDGSPAPDPPLAPEQVLGVVTAAYRDGACCWPRRAERWRAWLWVGRSHLLRVGRLWRRLWIAATRRRFGVRH
ncbi:MAG: S24/S26 family peptidase [Anaerolineae bacterium]